MRFIIVGLSVIFFSLSLIIIFKALALPVNKISFEDSQQDAPSESVDMISRLAETQDANKNLVEDLQATISRLEGQLATKEKVLEEIEIADSISILEEESRNEIIENAETADAENVSRTLAVFGGGTFGSGKDVINDIDSSKIENLVEQISAFPGSHIVIEGHTDNTRIRSFSGMKFSDNMGLSLLRARAIANILVSHGISLDRMSVIGYGDTRPVDVNYTEEGRAKNRRVEVKLSLKKKVN